MLTQGFDVFVIFVGKKKAEDIRKVFSLIRVDYNYDHNIS